MRLLALRAALRAALRPALLPALLLLVGTSRAGTRGGDAWMRAIRAQTEADVGRLRPFVRRIAEQLDVSTAIGADLRAFLERPDAAKRVYLALVRPRIHADPLTRICESVTVEDDAGRLLVPLVLRARADRLIDSLDETEDPSIGKLEREYRLELGRWYASRLPEGEPLRDVLASDRALRLAARAPVNEAVDPVRFLWGRTAMGRVLARSEKGGLAVNRHLIHETEALLDLLAEEHDILSRPKGPAGPAFEEPDRPVRVKIDLSRLDYTTKGLHLLKSSVFYNPRTRAGAFQYATQFEDHHTARLFGVWGWTAQTSKSLDEFLGAVRRRRPSVEALARTHEKLIFVINRMPRWLSASDDRATLEGGRQKTIHGWPPKDHEIWRRMVREFVTIFRDSECERYYEFWNEPDLEYWQSDLDAFLELYVETARVIKAADPEAKVGGCAVNRWNGGLRNDAQPDRPVTLELIRRARASKAPLDFISWHHFGGGPSRIAEAKSAFAEACGDLSPEFLVTEWSAPARGTPWAPIPFAETMVALFEADLDAQTVACWEEFHAKPDPGSFAPWGLVTQQGVRKNTWHAHRFFDRLARGSRGVAVVRDGERRRIVVSRKEGGIHDLLLWDPRAPEREQDAFGTLKEYGHLDEAWRWYGTRRRLIRAILDGTPRDKRWRRAFRAAREVYLGHGHRVRTPGVALEFEGAGSVEVLLAESVGMHRTRKAFRVRGNVVTLPLDRELLRLTVRVAGWERLETGTDEMLVSCFFLDADTGFLAGGDKERGDAVLLRTEDGGQTWRRVVTDIKARLYDVHFPTREVGYAVGFGGTILKSEDGGRSWRQLVSGTDRWLATVHFTSERSGWAAGGSALLETDDGGASWHSRRDRAPRGAGFRDLTFLDRKRGLAVGEKGLILTTGDGGATWNLRESGTDAWLRSIHFPEPGTGTGYVAGSRGVLLKTEDAGATWRRIGGPRTDKFNAVRFLDRDRGFLATMDGRLLETTDGGAHWIPILDARPHALTAIRFPSRAAGFVCGAGGSLYRRAGRSMGR